MKKVLFTMFLFGSFLSPVINEQIHTEPTLLLKEEVMDMDFLHREKVLFSIMEEESQYKIDAINHKENAVGVLQIRPIMVREVNEIIGENRYSNEDRFDLNKSVEMFVIYQNHFNPEWDLVRAARLWNGGCNGMKKNSTIAYSKRIEKRYEAI